MIFSISCTGYFILTALFYNNTLEANGIFLGRKAGTIGIDSHRQSECGGG